MANFIISPYAINFDTIKNALQNFINNKNNSSVIDTWTDFYTAGAGQTMVELDAAVAAFYFFHFILGRREAFLPVAQNYSSLLGDAETLGYCTSRGHNVHIKIKITPNNTLTLPKWSVIGSYSEYDIVLLEQATLTKDEEATLYCTIGNSAAQAITITSSDVQQFTFTASDTTDDYRLILNDTEVPVATNLEDAVDDKYITLSNSYGSIDVFYLNQWGNHINYSVSRGSEHGWTFTSGEAGANVPLSAKIYKDLVQAQSIVNTGDFIYTGSTTVSNYTYTTQDVLYLQYIQRNNLQFGTLSLSTFVVDYGEVTDFELVEDRKDVQDGDSIKLAAPVAHEVNNVIRARKDYSKYLLQDNTFNLIDVNDHDINPGLMAVTYLKKPNAAGNNLLTQEEKEGFMERVVKVCPDGVPNIYIEDPIPVIRTLNIELKQKSDDLIPPNVIELVEDILNEYKNKLQPEVDLEELENKLEQITGVKIARVDLGTQDYQLNHTYKLYDIVRVENILVGTEFQTWDMIAIKIQTKTGEYEPDWSSAGNYGDIVYDSDIVWERANKYVSSVPYRWKSRGDFNLYSDVAVGYDVYPNCTSYTMPNWDNVFVVDGNVTFNKLKTYDYVLSNWSENTGFIQDEYALFNRDEEYAVYHVKDLLHNSSAETPVWSDAEDINDIIEDNAIIWRMEYKGYDNQAEYYPGDEIAVVKNNKVYVYTANINITAETKYANTQKTGAEQDPFTNTPEEIKEWITDESQEGSVAWSLTETLDNYAEWQKTTAYEVDVYTIGDKNIFKVIRNDNYKTGTNWFVGLEEWPEEHTDNNIIWEKDTIRLGTNSLPAEGTTWYASTEYKMDDLIIVNGSNYTYIYNVVHLNDTINSNNNVIYSVQTFSAITGEAEPTWTYTKTVNGVETTLPYDNVEDNGILWTRTTNAGDTTWTPNTRMSFGTIINTSGGYFVFTSILGKSGETSPNWAGINGGIVVDNNITWQRIDKNIVLQLNWNEYLDLSYNLTALR